MEILIEAMPTVKACVAQLVIVDIKESCALRYNLGLWLPQPRPPQNPVKDYGAMELD